LKSRECQHIWVPAGCGSEPDSAMKHRELTGRNVGLPDCSTERGLPGPSHIARPGRCNRRYYCKPQAILSVHFSPRHVAIRTGSKAAAFCPGGWCFGPVIRFPGKRAQRLGCLDRSPSLIRQLVQFSLITNASVCLTAYLPKRVDQPSFFGERCRPPKTGMRSPLTSPGRRPLFRKSQHRHTSLR